MTDVVTVEAVRGFRTVAEGSRKPGDRFDVSKARLAFLRDRKGMVTVVGGSAAAKAAGEATDAPAVRRTKRPRKGAPAPAGG